MNMSGYQYTCSAGETFDSVALQIWGEEVYACELLGANPSLCTVSTFEGGEVLLIPVLQSENNGTRASETAPWKE